MPATFINEGLAYILATLGQDVAGGDQLWRIGLYVNNHAPVVTDTIAAYTAPSNTGYAVDAGAGWPSPPAVAGVCVTTIDTNVWVFTANVLAETVYGWTFELRDDGGTWFLAAAKLFAAPYLIPAIGGSLTATFTLSLQKLP